MQHRRRAIDGGNLAKTPKTAPRGLDVSAYGKSEFAIAQRPCAFARRFRAPLVDRLAGLKAHPHCRRNEISFAEGGAMGVPRSVTCVVLAALGGRTSCPPVLLLVVVTSSLRRRIDLVNIKVMPGDDFARVVSAQFFE